MTEAEWLACKNGWELAKALSFPTGRKYRLLLVASCRGRLDWPDERVRAAIDAAERFADGMIGVEELTRAESGMLAVLRGLPERMPGRTYDLLTLVHDATERELEAWSEYWGRLAFDELRPELIKDIWANPCRPLRADHALLVGYVRSLARVAYEEPNHPAGHLDPARLAVLADALEEAGCTDDALLLHLRSSGPHVRGCWALDLILGKE